MVDASPITPIGVVEPQRSTAKGAKLGGSGAGDSDEVYSLSQGGLKQYSEGYSQKSSTCPKKLKKFQI